MVPLLGLNPLETNNFFEFHLKVHKRQQVFSRVAGRNSRTNRSAVVVRTLLVFKGYFHLHVDIDQVSVTKKKLHMRVANATKMILYRPNA